MSRPSRKPLDPDLYADVVAEAKARFDVWPSAYASGWVVKTYKERGGRYAGGDKKTRTGLTKWFGESWVDLSRPIHDEDGELTGYEPCGRKKSGDPADYPKCRPAREAMRMTSDQVADAIKRKRAAEAKASRGGRGGRGARAPVRVSTYRANPGVVLYHRTTPANAAKIVRERRWMSREQPPFVFFSTDPYGHTSYGEALLEVVVPEDVARLDDEFPSGEQHYAVLTRDLAGLPVRRVE